ncbi:hypothetical protein D9758_007841 [Tetrapyrgos nigripes]|uniref:Peptidase A1 domain-containing protein n=1 Tax=Tetrapyrgos nigripes TaxID=182062 RepID=A0A8H5FVF7_9AGAR|nr:hypothetical protein D9758_007841 [Tetrapyrgos nigripes]
MPYRWKGKQRADPESVRRWYPRDDQGDLGSGGGDGILLPLLYIGLEGTDASYSVPIQIGSSGQSISLQIDTGSSDMWVASSSCSSGPCGNVPSNKRFDPSSSSDNVPNGQPFSINYLRGGVNGTVMFDTVSVGGYSIGGQAFAAADSVESESLSGDFSGIFGLALPANSIISSIVPPTTNSFDGATIGSNIFSLTPISLAPAARFLSLTLSRPGSDAVPALLGIGKHPTQQVPQIDQSKIVYSTPLPSMSSAGTSASQHFWKSSINDITVWVNGEPKSVSLTASAFTPGSSGPTAVLDTGIPVILATKALADGIYGALGIGPASDGNYYVDCSTPLNLTITLDGRAPIPVHPLDLTLVPPNDVSSKSCIGMIQAASTPISDMILGVPFLRSVYMVMAYQVPERDGSFTDLRPTEESDSEAGAAVVNEIRPRLGLQSLVDASTALDEFHQVRVLGQPLSNSPSNNSSGSGKSGHLSVGVEVLLGLIGFFALCVGLFALRFFLMRRKYNRGDIGNGPSTTPQNIPGGAQSGGLFGFFRRKKKSGYTDVKSRGEYELADTGKEGPPSSEDELRRIRYHAYLNNKERYPSSYSTSTARTRVDEEQGHADEFGGKKKRSPSAGSDARSQSDDHGHDATRNVYGDPWDPTTTLDWDNTNPTLVGKGPRTHRKNATELSDPQPPSPTAAERVPMLSADRLSPTAPSFAHVRERSVDLPPLPHDSPIEETPMVASTSVSIPSDLEEFGATSMAGIGTAARGSFIDTDIQFSHKHSGSMSSTASTLYNGRSRPGRSPSGPRGSSYSTGSHSNSYTLSGSGNRSGSSGLGS